MDVAETTDPNVNYVINDVLRKLPKRQHERTPDIDSDVMLQYYRVHKVS